MDRAIAFCVVVLLAFLSACSSEGVDFQMMTNFDGGDTVCLDMDLKDVVNVGIVLPSERQCEGGRFLSLLEVRRANIIRSIIRTRVISLKMMMSIMTRTSTAAGKMWALVLRG